MTVKKQWVPGWLRERVANGRQNMSENKKNLRNRDGEEMLEEDAGGSQERAETSDSGAKGADDPLKKLQAEKEELTNTLVRRQADFENYRKRVEKEREHDRHRGLEAFIESLLPVLDGFDAALAHIPAGASNERKGFELIERQFRDVLTKKGLQKIEAEGKEFDPTMHHAVEQVPSDQPEGTVLKELQAGYTFHGRVLRPTMVRVAAPAMSSKQAN
jgi:molecular chaperone GrpE